jgi:hypothetical protein
VPGGARLDLRPQISRAGSTVDETDLVYLLEEVLAPKGVEVKVLLLRLTGLAMIVQPGAALWLLGVAALFVVFTDTHSKTYRVAGGLAHARDALELYLLPRLERDDPLGMDPARLDLRTLPREQRFRLRRRLDHRVIRDGTPKTSCDCTSRATAR